MVRVAVAGTVVVTMILIFGTRGRWSRHRHDTGEFFCPKCGGDRQWVRSVLRRWFTVFFVPLFPVGRPVVSAIQCTTCATRFDEDVLGQPTANVLTAVGQLEDHYKLYLAMSDTRLTNLEQIPKAGEQVVHHAAGGSGLVSLAVVAEGSALLERDRALVGIELARDHAQQRALSSAVRSNQAGAFAELQPKADPLKQAFAAVSKTQVRDFQERQSVEGLA